LSHAARHSDWTAFHTSDKERRDWAPGNERSAALERKPLLDGHSEPLWWQNSLMDEALLQIILMSDGAVTGIKTMVIHPDSTRPAISPTSDLATIVDGFDSRFNDTNTHRGRLVVIKEAQDFVEEWKYSDCCKLMSREERDRAIAADTRTVDDIAIHYGLNKRTVQRIRKSLGVARAPGRPRNATRFANGTNTT
jgi:hypothetical protein